MKLSALPAEGYQGDVPEFPLPEPSERELDVWSSLWRTPQAAAWAVEPWRHRLVAQYARWSVRMESQDAPATIGNVVIRFADQIGLTPAGLRENGWSIVADEVTPRREAKAPVKRQPSARRLRVAADGGA